MRQITTHHDGHGLNESITILVDDTPINGASHVYEAVMPPADRHPLHIQFQCGPRNVEGSTPGVTEAVLYAILIDRLEGFQAGPYPCAANAEQLDALRGCLASTKGRADERAARNVLGTYAK